MSRIFTTFAEESNDPIVQAIEDAVDEGIFALIRVLRSPDMEGKHAFEVQDEYDRIRTITRRTEPTDADDRYLSARDEERAKDGARKAARERKAARARALDGKPEVYNV